MTQAFDVAVIGAGAAGMMCAAVAGQRGKRVVLIDHAEKLAEKIRISGGGRCNRKFTTNKKLTKPKPLSMIQPAMACGIPSLVIKKENKTALVIM